MIQQDNKVEMMMDNELAVFLAGIEEAVLLAGIEAAEFLEGIEVNQEGIELVSTGVRLLVVAGDEVTTAADPLVRRQYHHHVVIPAYFVPLEVILV